MEDSRGAAPLREALLTTPMYSVGELASRRLEPDAQTRLWVAREREDRRMFVVYVGGLMVVPAFQLTARSTPRVDLAPALAALLGADLDGWSVWAWLTSGTPLLSGAVPEQIAASQPERVLRAATRFAARSAQPSSPLSD